MGNSAILPAPFQSEIKNKVTDFICSINENVLVEHLTSCKIKETYFSFDEYLKKLEESNWQDIRKQFPVMDENFVFQKKNIENLLYDITNAFDEDKPFLQEKNIIRDQYIQDINIGEGDQHNGKSTAIVSLTENQKLVFKPTNAAISKSYFILLDWVGQYLDMGNSIYQIHNKKNYHWQEFVSEKHCDTSEDLQTYYKRAGYLLCILYIINATDYHAENLIAHGDTPVLIDHETVILPKISTHFKEYYRQFNEGKKDTVLNTFLLPNNEAKEDFPVGACGLGYSKQTHAYRDKKMGVNRFTKYWRMVTKLVEEDYIKCNIPTLNGKKVFAEEHLQDFLSGFEDCYQLLLKNKEFLLSQDSPIQHFNNVPIRYIWRSTSAYRIIINFMKEPKNLMDKTQYEQKIRNYLAVAYKNFPQDSPLLNILEHEITQVLRGDIPYFEVNSSSKDLETEFGTIKDFFELTAVENIERKLNKLTFEDLEYQKNLIIESLT
jgi:type 2 lantibiotic biosynthesis protein LanM